MTRLDRFVVFAIVAGVIGAAAGYRTMLRARPTVLAVEPPAVPPGERARVRLQGRNFQPFLQAYFVRSGEPFALNDLVAAQSGVFFQASTASAEVDIPPLGIGAYDLYLYDEGRRVAFRPAAVRVELPPFQREAVEATVRAFVPDEMVPLVRVGDRDRGQVVVRQVRVQPGVTETWDMRQRDRQQYVGVGTWSRAVDVTVSVPVGRIGSGPWRYEGAPVRAGEPFTLSTDRYVLYGVTLAVGRIE